MLILCYDKNLELAPCWPYFYLRWDRDRRVVLMGSKQRNFFFFFLFETTWVGFAFFWKFFRNGGLVICGHYIFIIFNRPLLAWSLGNDMGKPMGIAPATCTYTCRITWPENPRVYPSKQAQKHLNWMGIEGDMLKMSVSNHFDYNSAKIHPFGMFLLNKIHVCRYSSIVTWCSPHRLNKIQSHGMLLLCAQTMAKRYIS
jgi:hypothetical protein